MAFIISADTLDELNAKIAEMESLEHSQRGEIGYSTDEGKPLVMFDH